MNIDDRIKKDLTELYNNGATPGDIQNALLLDGLIQAENGQTSFATRALPKYYGGDRKAKTVMVMLNLGYGVAEANQSLSHDLERRSMKNAIDLENYHQSYITYNYDNNRKDNFDLKQAFFLHKWKDTGINLPLFSDKSELQPLLDARHIVLTQKLGLELIPYASRSFSKFNPQKIHLLVPFVETLFDEIFSHERKYVIFCSRKFHAVFDAYNKVHPDAIKFDKRYVSMGKIGDSKISGSCSLITINFKNKSLKAIIANTFPHQGLPNAYRLMEMYGTFCYKQYLKHIKNK